MKKGPRDAAASAEAQRLFDVAQLDLWASLLRALELPEAVRAELKEEVAREKRDFGELIQANVTFLERRDGAGYTAVTESLDALQRTVKTDFPSKPRQTVAEIVTLYQHAYNIEQRFNQVGCSPWEFMGSLHSSSNVDGNTVCLL